MSKPPICRWRRSYKANIILSIINLIVTTVHKCGSQDSEYAPSQ